MEDMAGFDELCFSLDYLLALCQKLASLDIINKEHNHGAVEFLFSIDE